MSIICLTTCDNVIEANFIKNNLENEDIQCFLANEISSTLLPGYSGMLNAGVKIMIEDSDFEKARLLINQSKCDAELKCPNCGSMNVSYGFGDRKVMKYIVVFFSLLLGICFGNVKKNLCCKDCKTEF